MKQIFDEKYQKELANFLKEADIENSYSIVYKIYKKELKNAVINKLNFIIDCIKKDDYKEIEKNIMFSGAGDECGQDNYYIDFSDVTDCDDIMNVVERLKQ